MDILKVEKAEVKLHVAVECRKLGVLWIVATPPQAKPEDLLEEPSPSIPEEVLPGGPLKLPPAFTAFVLPPSHQASLVGATVATSRRTRHSHLSTPTWSSTCDSSTTLMTSTLLALGLELAVGMARFVVGDTPTPTVV